SAGLRDGSGHGRPHRLAGRLRKSDRRRSRLRPADALRPPAQLQREAGREGEARRHHRACRQHGPFDWLSPALRGARQRQAPQSAPAPLAEAPRAVRSASGFSRTTPFPLNYSDIRPRSRRVLPFMIGKVLAKVIGTQNEREIKRLRPLVVEISALEPQMQALSVEQLRAKTEEFKTRVAAGQSLDAVLAEGFAVGR